MQVVVLQIFFIWISVFYFYLKVAKRDGRAPIDDLGVWWLLVFMLYSTLAPLAWILQGGQYSPLSGRLYTLQPSTMEVIYLLNIAIAYVISFIFFYMLFQVRPPSSSNVTWISSSRMFSAIFVIFVALTFDLMLRALGFISSSDSYAESYMKGYALPLGLRQIIKVISGFSAVASLVLIVASLQRWPKYRFLVFIYLLSIILAIDPDGGRGKVVTPLIAFFISWHVLIRPIPTRKIFFLGVVGLTMFLIFGALRSINSMSEARAVGFEGIGLNEFDHIWANHIELLQARNSGRLNLGLTTRFGELFSFIPSQFLWFEKLSLNDWYLNNFYPGLKEDTGTGFVFGAISQAVVGDGLFEALLRGAILGSLAGVLMVGLRRHFNKWWRFPLHLSLISGVFAGIRETTFIQIDWLVQIWLFAPLFITISASFFELKIKKKEY